LKFFNYVEKEAFPVRKYLWHAGSFYKLVELLPVFIVKRQSLWAAYVAHLILLFFISGFESFLIEFELLDLWGHPCGFLLIFFYRAIF